MNGRRRIAVVGTGVSGLVACHLLHARHDLTVFEADDRIGGHTNTVPVERDGVCYPVDTGFIVFNDRTYPNFVRLLDELGVGSRPSTMSFSVHCERTGFEYNGTGLNGLFARRRNLLSPSFHGMLRDVLRFNREAPAVLDEPPRQQSLEDYVARNGYGRAFLERYVLPMGAAIWSAEPRRLRAIPVQFLVRFLHNHGMLSLHDRPVWRVVRGGSRSYVDALVAPFRRRIRTSTPVRAVRRHAEGVTITLHDGSAERFDKLILATHSDQALRLLTDPSPAERDILGAIPYQANEAVLHTDDRLMPRRRRAWGAWNYRIPDDGRAPVAVTYNMNILQGFDAPVELCVTLNQSDRIDPARVLRRICYHHPVFTHAGVAAQTRHAEISGVRHTFYCGAYWGFGFHEDGVRSGLAVARQLGTPRVEAA